MSAQVCVDSCIIVIIAFVPPHHTTPYITLSSTSFFYEIDLFFFFFLPRIVVSRQNECVFLLIFAKKRVEARRGDSHLWAPLSKNALAKLEA